MVTGESCRSVCMELRDGKRDEVSICTTTNEQQGKGKTKNKIKCAAASGAEELQWETEPLLVG